jgi:DNA polymerase-3 subunit gamma/tau
LYSTLTSGQPELGKGYQVSFQVDNSLQEEAILQKKNEIEIRLQRALRNGQIDLQVHVKEAKEGRKLYTDEDKFNFLKEKNATLELLKQKFNLDFE